MATQVEQLHFVLFPLMAQGHMTPMIDIARLLAQQGVIVTIVTTPHNAARFKSTLDRAIESGLSIRLAEFRFPCAEAGLPEGCENFDMLPSFSLALNFFQAANMLEKPVQKLFEELMPRPSCIISDVVLSYTLDIANRFQIPRIVFNGGCCFLLLCLHNLLVSKIYERITSESEYFVVPNMPDRVEFTKAQIPEVMLLAQQGVIVTIVTTPHNAARFKSILDRAIESGLSIRLVEFRFPCAESGLPEGCENFDMLPSFSLALNFFQAANMLKKPVQKLFEELMPRPSCIISDVFLSYTLDIANRFQIPRIVFHGVCCFLLLCLHNLRVSKILERVTSESEYFVVPNMPDTVEFTKAQIPEVIASPMIVIDINLTCISRQIQNSKLEST
ncbi:hypothetical protein QUC31_010208 [Theobroma cacao]